MRFLSLIKVALKAIAKNKMRSLLTMLGIIIGVGAVIVMVAIGQGAQATVEDQISQLGTNLIIIFPGASKQGMVSLGAGSNSRLTLDDVEKVQKNTTFLSGVSPVIRVGIQAIGGAGNWSTAITGVSPDFLQIRQWSLQSGEFFTTQDIRAQTKVCVIGTTLVKNLFPYDDPIGQQLRIRSVPFKIIGVLSEKGQSASGDDQDDIILAPYTTVQYRLSGWRGIRQILCSASSEDIMPQAQEEIRSVMREAHKIPVGEDEDFTIRNQTDIAQAAAQTTEVMTFLLAAIASISLVVGGIGIMNIMLVSVTERTREIGIRMAIGARESDIMIQFLIEAITLSLSGGIVGIIFGIVGTSLVKSIGGWNTSISISTVAISFIFSGVIGIFFGFYPARKASSLNPIDALHFE
jgi:putative ABC transport system permease protein